MTPPVPDPTAYLAEAAEREKRLQNWVRFRIPIFTAVSALIGSLIGDFVPRPASEAKAAGVGVSFDQRRSLFADLMGPLQEMRYFTTSELESSRFTKMRQADVAFFELDPLLRDSLRNRTWDNIKRFEAIADSLGVIAYKKQDKKTRPLVVSRLDSLRDVIAVDLRGVLFPRADEAPRNP